MYLSLINTSQNREVTGGGSFNVGDSFNIVISNAPPNAQIIASSTQNGGSHGSMVMGTTNGSGAFQLSGSMSRAEIGAWVETWNIAGDASKTISFNVIDPTAQTQSGNTNSGGQQQQTNTTNTTNGNVNPNPFQGGTNTSGGGNTILPNVGGFDLSGIPTTYLLGGAVILVFLLLKK